MPAGPSLADARRRYAAAICRDAGTVHPRVEQAFATIPRENFLTDPPWRIFAPGGLLEDHTSDPAALYQDVLVVLDAGQGINNGQPSLHAAWLALIDPQPGDGAVQIGAGTGYYTAILAALVASGGRVDAYEIDPALAARARANLEGFDCVVVHAETGLGAGLPPADIVYVNAGIAAPDPSWLRALKPGGRLVFPWQPDDRSGVTMLVRRRAGGLEAAPSLHVSFIGCVGQGAEGACSRPAQDAVARTRSLWLTETRAPDATATAVSERVWFSSEAVA